MNPVHLVRGRLVARLARDHAEVHLAQILRHRAFLTARGRGAEAGRDADRFDDLCQHMLILSDDVPVACYRLRLFAAAELADSYAAQFYDLAPLAGHRRPMLELGRFCLAPDQHDPDILRLAWAALAVVVDGAGVDFLFGCSSFAGADPLRHAAALSLLSPRIGPADCRPAARAPETVSLRGLAAPISPLQALGGLPPLLRSYLGMGGWVSDHAVIDRDFDTLHVFTGLDTSRIPAARARALRCIATNEMG